VIFFLPKTSLTIRKSSITSAWDVSLLENLLHSYSHVRHVLGDGLDSLHQTYRLESGRVNRRERERERERNDAQLLKKQFTQNDATDNPL